MRASDENVNGPSRCEVTRAIFSLGQIGTLLLLLFLYFDADAPIADVTRVHLALNRHHECVWLR